MQNPPDWGGIYPASLTIFDRVGRIDAGATAAHIDRLVDEGANGVVIGGTSGEFILLDEAERVRLIEIGVEAVRGRVPVIAGTGYASTEQTIRLTRRAASIGADGAIVILPYFLRPTVQEVADHFAAVGKASPVPIMIYNNPANSAAPPLGVREIRALHEAGHAAAIKSTFPTVHEVHEIRAELAPEFKVFYGSFMAPLEGFAGGAHGWISGILNVVTPDAVRMWTAIQRGDLEAARTTWRRILPIKLFYTRQPLGPAGDLAIYRAILRLRGLDSGYSRPPVRDLTEGQVEQLRALLSAADESQWS